MSSQAGLDKKYMQLALELAEKGRFTCQPNPMVGCVIVKDSQIIGKGFHQKAGEGHAEINALANIATHNSAKEATAYVTLEPCFHYGKTPPCVDALIDAKIKRVVIASLDPNPQVAGQGANKLREADIAVDILACETLIAKANELNKAFFKRMRENMPYVVLKVATTLDGKTADYQGDSQWISSPDSRADVQQLRASSCAVLTGTGTLLADNPSLNVRLEGVLRQPYRVLLDSKARLNLKHKIIGDDRRLILLTANSDVSAGLLKKLARVDSFSDGDKVSIIKTLKFLAAELQINQLMVEAGATLSGAFIESGWVDEIVQYIAPSILGAGSRGAFEFSNAIPFSQKIDYSIASFEQIDTDLKIIYKK